MADGSKRIKFDGAQHTAIKIAISEKGVTRKRDETRDETLGDARETDAFVHQRIEHVEFHEQAKKLANKARALDTRYTQTFGAGGWLHIVISAEAKIAFDDELRVLLIEVEDFNAQPGNPHTLVVESNEIPIELANAPGIQRDLCAKVNTELSEARALLAAGDVKTLVGWINTNRGLAGLLPFPASNVVATALEHVRTERNRLAKALREDSPDVEALTASLDFGPIDDAIGWTVYIDQPEAALALN